MNMLTKNEIATLLAEGSHEGRDLFQLARKERDRVFGKRIFLYGFAYFSTWCRNNCNFCYYRKSNDIERYRKTKDELLPIIRHMVESGVNLIDLTMGEDPIYHEEQFRTLLEIVKQIKEEMDVPVMISPGVIDTELIDKFAEIGTDWYALYQETHNRALFRNLRVGQSYDERMERKLYAQKKGMLIEEGLLSGIGEGCEDIAESLLTMGSIGASQMRVMSFVPQAGSPMENLDTPDRQRELRIIALMRILYPHVLIPASLDVDGIKGLESRINAGANVVTSIIPPASGLMGVAQSKMDVDEGGRTAGEVGVALENMGLHTANTAEYRECINELRSMTGKVGK